jgi:murein DD-endopeptidase MepM/ murein hydrolase activator NlpD
MMRITKDVQFAFVLCAGFLFLASASALEGKEATGSNGVQDSRGIDAVTIDRKTLVNKRFQFSWTSQEEGGINGIATLKEDGSIEGIDSPNETTWLIDALGRLLFKHADGRISTRYDKVWREDGLLCFEGSFLFREGITHHLIEIEGAASEPSYKMTPDKAAKIKYSTQQFVYLDPGQTRTFRLKDGTEKRITLVSVKEYEDPVIHLIRRADVKVEIDGRSVELTCAPYVMPMQVQGLRIQVDTTSAWLDIPRRVQFSLWDVSDPIVDTSLFCFPLPGYRLFSHGMQAYNEPVHLGDRDGDPQGQRFYHNYGVDLAGYEGRQKVLSCISGTVVRTDHDQGSLFIRDDRGFILYYGHLDSILPEIKVGSAISRGQWVGILGKRGASGNFSHLHVGAYLSESAMNMDRLNRNLNLYPWLVATYQHENTTNLYAVARPHKMAITGNKVLFDGSNSMSFKSKITSFKWKFHDGTSADGPVVEKVYDKPGCYIASLWVKNAQGDIDVDFCKVKVFSRSAPEGVIPTLFITYYPSAQVYVDDPVNFRLWPQGMEVENIRIEFDDGTIIRNCRAYSAVTHKFKTLGIHIATVTGTAGKLPVMQKVKIVVQQ